LGVRPDQVGVVGVCIRPVGEAALHYQVGGPDVLLSQLRYLLEVAAWDTVDLRLVSYSAGWHGSYVAAARVSVIFISLPDWAGWAAPGPTRQGGLPGGQDGKAEQVAGHRAACLTAVLAATLCGTVACSGQNPATDFCTSYGTVMHGLVAAAKQYDAYPENFSSVYRSTLESLRHIRAKAPDNRLRSAFDTAAFTFSVFNGDRSFAQFLTRADFSGNAVVIACAEYGVDVRV
jgi:hypothetical protein